MTTAKEREDQVLAVLLAAKEPLGPTEIGRRVNSGWCRYAGDYPNSAVIVPVLRRIGAVKVGFGKYVKPAVA